jgi:tetratricopeptide (TPR) repeat protein
VLARADEILRVSEKIFDDAQAAHGKPVAARRPSQLLYSLLGNAHMAVGNYREALEAYRYGRGIDPSWPELYDRAATAHRASGDLRAASRMELQKAFALGLSPPLVEAVERAYAQVPGGSCAVVRSGGVPLLNPQCERLREDFCRVIPELAGTFADARKPDRAAAFSRMSLQYGCAQGR